MLTHRIHRRIKETIDFQEQFSHYQEKNWKQNCPQTYNLNYESLKPSSITSKVTSTHPLKLTFLNVTKNIFLKSPIIEFFFKHFNWKLIVFKSWVTLDIFEFLKHTTSLPTFVKYLKTLRILLNYKTMFFFEHSIPLNNDVFLYRKIYFSLR